VIQSGKCIIEKGGVEVAMCGPRDFFGERVLVLAGEFRGATVVSTHGISRFLWFGLSYERF
jgi:hypothetical protein